jgi:molecular chaperone GrpE
MVDGQRRTGRGALADAAADAATNATQDEPAAASDATAAAGGSDLTDQLRRERADFLNYKRRQERDRADDRVRERADVVARLLPLLDDLDRALAQLPPDLAANSWARGVALSRSQLMSALAGLGIERVGAEGEAFDPAIHEAQSFETRPGIANPSVAAVVRPGYRIGDRLIRPAQVNVVGPPRSAHSSTPSADQER